MDEDIEAKAHCDKLRINELRSSPVTRLRRRLSVEQREESMSPTPSTPTKKKGRLAAKPQLDLIEEHAIAESPSKRSTRKSVSRDVDGEEAPLTPARRSTRIRSNASLVSDTTVLDRDTPRAKRAARRISLLGSDSETPLTPTRVRGSRRDSTSSIDKQVTPDSEKRTPVRASRGKVDSTNPDQNLTTAITVVVEVTEEQDTDAISLSNTDSSSQPLTQSSQNISPNSVRKSSRLMLKKSLGSTATVKDDDKTRSSDSQEQAKTTDEPFLVDKTVPDKEEGRAQKINTPNARKETLSLSSSTVTSDLGKKSTTKSGVNKSTSAIDANDKKITRQRTKSWTKLTVDQSSDDSLREGVNNEKELQKQLIPLVIKLPVDGFDGKTELASETRKSHVMKKNIQESVQVNPSDENKSTSLTCTPADADTSNESNKENVDGEKKNSSTVEPRFDRNPTISIESLEFIEDSDLTSIGKFTVQEGKLPEDQCVPVVYHVEPSLEKPVLPIVAEDKVVDDRSIEPMDIDETMPENVSLISASRSRHSSLNMPQHANSKIDDSHKSNRKSSISNTTSKSFEQSGNENKSTLILSELNVSTTSEKNASKSLYGNKSKRESSMFKDCRKSDSENICASKSERISLTDSNIQVENKKSNRNALLSCLTSTPVREKDNKASGMLGNTSVITPIIESGNNNKIHKSKKPEDVTMSENSASENDLDEDSSKDRNCMIDDEAMDAGDDYQSGDSQDEEERRYDKDHEIADHGETLTTDDEENLSTDSEYEKDSFLVSSDEEDNDLLSGSGDDLSLSDNELSMSKKSKKKYNERKTKEQKQASRAMFEARHQEKSGKDAVPQRVKKNNRLRLDSSHSSDSEDKTAVPSKQSKCPRKKSDLSVTKSDIEKSVDEIGYKKKKSKRLSESICIGDALNENEMTILGNSENKFETDDPLVVKVKQEPKTPQKDFDISTVHFTDRAEMEQVEVPENVTIMKANETSDPLQTSLTEDDESISENEEATQNFNSILKDLSNKHLDSSLNFSRKKKEQAAEKPIDKQVGFTPTKDIDTKKRKKTNHVHDGDESSSKSIDVNILFTDERNDGDKDDDGGGIQKATITSEKIIPLKKCEGKTNLLQNTSTDEAMDSLNDNDSMVKKNKKRKSHKQADTVTNGDDDIEEVGFFIDTVGAYGNMNEDASVTPLLNISSKKNKQKKDKVPLEKEEAVVIFNNSSTKIHNKHVDESSVNDGAVDNLSLNTSSKKKKKKKLKAATDFVDEGTTHNAEAFSIGIKKDKSEPEVKIQKKKDKAKEAIAPFVNDNTATSSASVNLEENKKEKKKKKKDKVTQMIDTNILNYVNNDNDRVEASSVNDNTIASSSQNIKEKKKNKHKKDEATELYENAGHDKIASGSRSKRVNDDVPVVNDDIIDNTTFKKSKKHGKKSNKMKDENDLRQILGATDNVSENKKKTKSKQLEETPGSIDSVIDNSTGTKKPKQKSFVAADDAEEKIAGKINSLKSKKKKPDTGNVTNQTESVAATHKTEYTEEPSHSRIKKHKPIEKVHDEQTDGRGIKRKKREDEDVDEKSKIKKKSSSDQIHVPRLPDTVLNKLKDKPETKVWKHEEATTSFNVESIRKTKKNKPSDFLEESIINLYDDKAPAKKKRAPKMAAPEIPSFIPLPSTAGSTTNFQIKVFTAKMECRAKSDTGVDFKTGYLQERRNTKLRTYDRYRKHKNIRITKF